MTLNLIIFRLHYFRVNENLHYCYRKLFSVYPVICAFLRLFSSSFFTLSLKWVVLTLLGRTIIAPNNYIYALCKHPLYLPLPNILQANDVSVFNRLPFVSTLSKGFVFIVF